MKPNKIHAMWKCNTERAGPRIKDHQRPNQLDNSLPITPKRPGTTSSSQERSRSTSGQATKYNLPSAASTWSAHTTQQLGKVRAEDSLPPSAEEQVWLSLDFEDWGIAHTYECTCMLLSQGMNSYHPITKNLQVLNTKRDLKELL